jgi:hypothetical protein
VWYLGFDCKKPPAARDGPALFAREQKARLLFAFDVQQWPSGTVEVWRKTMKTPKASNVANVGAYGGARTRAHARALSGKDPASRLQPVNSYLEKNFPDFFAEARFQVGDDDYFLYARFGQYLARTIEQNRASRDKINRGFTVLNKMARVSARHPRIRQMMVSGPLEYIVDAPKARALARKRLSPVAQGYMESLCE